MSKIEEVKYIDVNNVSDHQDTYNYLSEKLGEIIKAVNELIKTTKELDKYVSAMSKYMERGN